jgi:CPA1 family monovalent cation:H+ antiporter
MTAISGVEFLIWLLIAASTIAVLAKYLRIPYTVALVLGGLLLSLLHLPFLSPLQPDQRPHWLTPDVILILFLPALVFEGSVKIQVRDLLRDWAPLLVLANVGVLLATLVTGYLVHWAIGLPILIALLFGAIISATDPISVLAIFKELRMNKRLSVIIEGESPERWDGGSRFPDSVCWRGCRRTRWGKGNRTVFLGSRRGSGSRV